MCTQTQPPAPMLAGHLGGGGAPMVTGPLPAKHVSLYCLFLFAPITPVPVLTLHGAGRSH